ncbi:MAG: preprotein translocase subunit SecA, partial [Clostridia bacterium]|nr:preprotein translocase subunit SecA [Clostridia bacterium]
DGLGGSDAESQAQLDEALAPFTKLFLPAGAVKISELGAPVTREKLTEVMQNLAVRAYEAREKAFGTLPNGIPLMRELERVVMLRVVDEYWMDHIDAMDDLRRGIGLRGYGSVKPIDAYKQEGFDMFEAMVAGIREETVRRLYTVRVRGEQTIQRKAVAKNATANAGGEPEKKKPVKKIPKPGRNDPCPCGKMKADGSRRLKYKECCGRNE